MKSKASEQKRYLRIISTPIRALCKARDFYVNSMMDYADRMNYRSVAAIPVTSQASGLPRSFSVNSARSGNEEDFQKLARASSARDRLALDLYIKQKMNVRSGSRGGPRAMPPRSSSVAMGRIDEDSPCCYFGEINNNISAKNEIKYPRSRSHAVSARRLSVF